MCCLLALFLIYGPGNFPEPHVWVATLSHSWAAANVQCSLWSCPVSQQPAQDPCTATALTDILLQHLLTIKFLCFAIVIPTTDAFLINHWIYSNLNVRRSKWMHSPWSCSGKMSSHLSHYNRLYFHFIYFPFLAEFQAIFQFPNQAAS